MVYFTKQRMKIFMRSGRACFMIILVKCCSYMLSIVLFMVYLLFYSPQRPHVLILKQLNPIPPARSIGIPLSKHTLPRQLDLARELTLLPPAFTSTNSNPIT
jgi:hypothetical protein